MSIPSQTKTKLYGVLNGSRLFNLTDFDVAFGDGTGLLIEIVYAHNPDFRYRCVKASIGFTAVRAPVAFGALATAGLLGEDMLIRDMKGWLNLLEAEVRADPIARELENQQKVLTELRKKCANLGDEMFTRAEATAFDARLEALRAELAIHLADVFKNKQELQAQLDSLRAEVDAIKAQARVRPRKHVILGFFARLGGFVKDNPQLIATTTDFIQKLLPPAGGS